MLSATKKAEQGEMIGNDNILVRWSGKANLRRQHLSCGLADDNHHLPLFPHGGCFSHSILLALLDQAPCCPMLLEHLSPFGPSSSSAAPGGTDSSGRKHAPFDLCARLSHSQLCCTPSASLCFSFPQQPVTSFTCFSILDLHSAGHTEYLWT